MIKHQLYEAPVSEVLELRLEGMIAVSNITRGSVEETYDGGSDEWTIVTE